MGATSLLYAAPMLRSSLAILLLLPLASCAAPPAKPAAHDNPILFGKTTAPVEVVIWLGLRNDQSKSFIKTILPALLDGAVKSGTVRVRLEPVSDLDGTLPAVGVLWCVQNTVHGDTATRSASTLLLLQAMQATPPNGSPGYGEAWWLEQSAITAGLAPNLVAGCLGNELAAEAVRKSYLVGKAASLRNMLLLPQVSINGQVVNVLDTPAVTLKDIEDAIAKAGS